MTEKKRTIKITYDEVVKIVDYDSFINGSVGMLRDFGFPSVTSEGIKEQVENILHDRQLNVIGVFLEKYIVREGGK
jgi:hypothetical protein